MIKLYTIMITHFTNEFPTKSWKEIFPTVVSAEKLGNTSPKLIPILNIYFE